MFDDVRKSDVAISACLTLESVSVREILDNVNSRRFLNSVKHGLHVWCQGWVEQGREIFDQDE